MGAVVAHVACSIQRDIYCNLISFMGDSCFAAGVVVLGSKSTRV